MSVNIEMTAAVESARLARFHDALINLQRTVDRYASGSTRLEALLSTIRDVERQNVELGNMWGALTTTKTQQEVDDYGFIVTALDNFLVACADAVTDRPVSDTIDFGANYSNPGQGDSKRNNLNRNVPPKDFNISVEVRAAATAVSSAINTFFAAT